MKTPDPARLQTLIASGKRAFSEEDYTRAADIWPRAASEARALDDGVAAGEADLWLSRTLAILGNYAKSLQHADDCVAGAVEDSRLAAECLNMKSLASRRLGMIRPAVSHARVALEIALASGDKQIEAESRRNLGAALQKQGDFRQALELYEQSLEISQSLDDQVGLIKSLNFVGGYYRVRAEYARALEFYERALNLSRNAGSRLHQSRLNGELCAIFYRQSDYDRALEYCRTALKQAQQINALPQVAYVTNTMGAIHLKQHEPSSALDFFKKSAEVKRHMEDRRGLARTLNNIGLVYGDTGSYAKALEYLDEALQINRELNNRPGQAANYGNMCRFSNAQKRYANALKQCQSALELWLASERPEELWRTYDNMSIAYSGLVRSGAAIYFGKQAVNTLQEIRNANVELQKSYRKTYIGTRMDVYRRLSDLLINSGRFLEAEQVLAMLKEEEYFDFIRGGGDDLPGDTRASLNSREELANSKYLEITDQLVRIGKDFQRLMQSGTSGRNDVDRARMAELREQLVFAEKEFSRFVDELRVSEDFREGEPSLSVDELEALTPLQATLGTLDKSAVAIHFLVMPEKLHIIVSSSDPGTPPYHRDIAINHIELSNEILEYRGLLTEPGSDPMPKAKKLYDYLLRPVAGTLEELDARTLLLYLDRDLRYLPVSALHDGESYVAQKYATVMYTPAVKQKLVEQSGKAWKVAALGVSKENSGFEALPSVVEEVDAIVKENDADLSGVLPGVSRLDEAFTRDSFSEVLWEKNYSVVHIASHFKLDPASDDASELLLGDGLLKVSDITSTDFPFYNVELLTLSACQTGLGSDDIAGREIESFSSKAQDLGARSVIATLWNVADASTGMFMRYYYQLHEAYGLSKSEALRLTQELFIKGEVSTPDGDHVTYRGVAVTDMPDSHTPNSHPYFWAPFVLSGNWL